MKRIGLSVFAVLGAVFLNTGVASAASQFPGCGIAIADAGFMDQDMAVWVIGCNGGAEGQIFAWSGNYWQERPGVGQGMWAAKVAVTTSGEAWIVRADGRMYRTPVQGKDTNLPWQAVTPDVRATQITTAGNTVWILDNNARPGPRLRYFNRTTNNWVTTSVNINAQNGIGVTFGTAFDQFPVWNETGDHIYACVDATCGAAPTHLDTFGGTVLGYDVFKTTDGWLLTGDGSAPVLPWTWYYYTPFTANPKQVGRDFMITTGGAIWWRYG